MKITFISSFVPRKCGIATYMRDVISEIDQKSNRVSVIAMEDLISPISYSSPVEGIIRQNVLEDYINFAKAINEGGSDIVHLQHEFGLFGGKSGVYILELVERLSKPLVTTFHTVLLTPTPNQKRIISQLAILSRKILVMDQPAKNRLEKSYGVSPAKVEVIRHGAPKILDDRDRSKAVIGYPDSFILLSSNLLSRSKGLQYAINALPQAVKEIPNLLFLIVGETHPTVLSREGESYRQELVDLVKKLKLESHVIFKNEYVALDDLRRLLSAADICITPYLDVEQSSSGTLSYAVGAGRVCISTRYAFAKEILSRGLGVTVPFRNSGSIAKALIDLNKHPEKMRQIEEKAHALGDNLSWSNVAGDHLKLYSKIISDKAAKINSRSFGSSGV